MFTSTTKLIAALAISAGLLATSSAFAKNGSGNSGGNHSQSHSQTQSQSQKNTSTFNSFKLSSSNSTSNNGSNSTSISKKPITLSQNFSKKDSNKDHKSSTLGISLNSMNSMKNDHKDSFCKKDKCWFDSCCSKSCYPYYFGCYYPIYSCYDYCTPTYTTCSYTVVPNVQPSRTLVAVGSILMINGQTFGNQPGGARLRINGMAMPIEVLEWTPAGVKVRLPQIEIAGVTPAEIEVIRGDGSLAAKSPVDLTGMPGQVAFNR
jgi:hypothetical protein